MERVFSAWRSVLISNVESAVKNQLFGQKWIAVISDKAFLCGGHWVRRDVWDVE